MARCDVCGNAPKWIYRVGEEEICGACCAKRLSEQRAENAKLREALKDEPCAVCGTHASDMLGDYKCVACERDDARYHIQRWAEGTQVVGSHRSCQCAICETLYRKAERLKEEK